MIAQQLVKLLAARGETISCAESLTGGLLCDAVVQVPGASKCFMGGIVRRIPDAWKVGPGSGGSGKL